jgi:hypothetical protein
MRTSAGQDSSLWKGDGHGGLLGARGATVAITSGYDDGDGAGSTGHVTSPWE